MNSISVIYTQEVLNKNFNIYGDLENALFLAKDVADWIEHSNVSKMINSVDEDEKVKAMLPITNSYTLGHGGLRENTEAWFLTEDGLYEVLMQSRKPIAKQFKKKVKEILKGLRRGELQIMGNELTKNNTDDLINSVIQSNNNTAACMQQMTQMTQQMAQMMGIMLQLVQNNTNTQTTQEISVDDDNAYIKSCIRPAVGKHYTMTEIAQDVKYELSLSYCDARKINVFLDNKGVLRKVTGVEHNGEIYSNFYIFSEQYRDKYSTTLIPSINKRTETKFLNTLYSGKDRAFIIKYIKEHAQEFIES